MSLNRKLAYNTLAQFSGKALGTLIALFATTQLLRYLGPTEYGKFHIILTFVQLAGILADMGLYLIILNDISLKENNHNSIISQHFVFRFYLNIVYLVGMGILALFVPYESAIKWGIFLMAFSNTFIWFSQIFQTWFQKSLTTQYIAMAEVIGRGALLVSTIIMIHYKVGLVPLTLTVVIGQFAGFLISWYYSRGKIKITWHLNRSYIKDVFGRTWPVAVSIWFSLLYFKADTIILSFYESDYIVGIYGMPYRILETLVTLPLLFMSLMIPLLSRSHGANDLARFKSYMQKGFDALSIIASLLLFAALPLAKPIVLLLGGSAFKESAPILRILMLGVFVIFIGALFGHAIITINKQKVMIKYYMSIALVMLLMYIIFIPIFSYWAAAWLTVIGEFLVFCATFYMVFKFTRFRPRFTILVKSIISGIIMSAAVYVVRGATLFITIPFAVGVYTAVMYMIGGIKKELVREVLSIKAKIKN